MPIPYRLSSPVTVIGSTPSSRAPGTLTEQSSISLRK
jgi:hypothetical protein